MNHIYKTIFNKKTGQITVVSENSSNQSRSQQGSDHKKKAIQENKPSTSISIISKSALTLAIGLILGGTTAFAETIYTGDSADLKTSQSVGGNFDQLIGSSTANGVVAFDTNNPVIPSVSNTDITIDYSSGTTPNFVLSGYSYVNGDDNIENIDASKNTITLKQGEINGPIYAGLAHYTSITDDITCPNTTMNCTTNIYLKNTISKKQLNTHNNIINILNGYSTQTTSDIYAGYTSVDQQYKNITTATASTNASATAHAEANANTISSNENQITINGSENSFNNINAGYAGSNIRLSD